MLHLRAFERVQDCPCALMVWHHVIISCRDKLMLKRSSYAGKTIACNPYHPSNALQLLAAFVRPFAILQLAREQGRGKSVRPSR